MLVFFIVLLFLCENFGSESTQYYPPLRVFVPFSLSNFLQARLIANGIFPSLL